MPTHSTYSALAAYEKPFQKVSNFRTQFETFVFPRFSIHVMMRTLCGPNRLLLRVLETGWSPRHYDIIDIINEWKTEFSWRIISSPFCGPIESMRSKNKHTARVCVCRNISLRRFAEYSEGRHRVFGECVDIDVFLNVRAIWGECVREYRIMSVSWIFMCCVILRRKSFASMEAHTHRHGKKKMKHIVTAWYSVVRTFRSRDLHNLYRSNADMFRHNTHTQTRSHTQSVDASRLGTAHSTNNEQRKLWHTAGHRHPTTKHKNTAYDVFHNVSSMNIGKREADCCPQISLALYCKIHIRRLCV